MPRAGSRDETGIVRQGLVAGMRTWLKVSRTLADLGEQEKIGAAQLAEAIAYRGIDCQKNQG